MNQNFISRLRCVAVLSCLIAQAASANDGNAGRPNIIVVLVDDAGFADFPFYRDERPRTPNIDQLATEGLRFTQYYVNSPICSPSRVALTTGQYPARWGVTSFIAARQQNARRGMRDWLDPAAPAAPRMLQQAGYATGHFGKWHMGGGRDVGDAPLISEYGFDASLTQFEGLGDRLLAWLDKYDGSEPEKMGLALDSEQLGRGNVKWMDRSQVTGEFTRHAIDFIKQAEQNGKPFYVNVWPDDVHTPLFPPKELRGDESKRQLYLGVLEAMDRQLGELFTYVRNSPTLKGNTIIIVTSDNGFEPGAGSAGDLRGSKGALFEGGVRDPLVVWGPGLMDAEAVGRTNSRTVISSVDVVASLLEIAGVEPPESVKLDGEDLSPSLLGREQQVRKGPLFWSRPPDRHSFAGENMPDLAIREGKWKLLVEYDGSNVQLYDLAADPNEAVNVADQQPRVAQQMSARVLAWFESLPAASKATVTARHFTNPIYEGADPWVIQHEDQYLLCQSDGNRGISIHASKDLTKLAAKHVVWRAPADGPVSREVWAPELHRLDGRWYVYFAASDGENRNHRTYVLESAGDDPLGPYELRGPVYTGDDPAQKKDNRWSIDATVLEHPTGRYMLWSGWEGEADEQWLYIAKMKSPYELAGTRVKICDNDDHLWERVSENPDERGLHEAPQMLQRNGRTFVLYSTSSSWQPTYKLGMLELRRDGDPMNPADWKKFDKPVFQATRETYGVGHASFVKSPDGAEDWIVYHAKCDREDGWRRAVFAQPYAWTADGLPDFGKPVAAGVPLPLPSGTPQPPLSKEARSVPRFQSLEEWTYFGHHQLYDIRDGRLHLGVKPTEPINVYRSGEKVLLNGGEWTNLAVEATVRIVAGDRDAGILFRVTRPAIGYDAQEGYFAGIVPRTGRVVLGATDGAAWRQIADAPADVEAGRDYRLRIVARGASIVVSLDGVEVLRAEDDAFSRGAVGLRVVDSEAAFSELTVKPLRREAPEKKNQTRRPDATAA